VEVALETLEQTRLRAETAFHRSASWVAGLEAEVSEFQMSITEARKSEKEKQAMIRARHARMQQNSLEALSSDRFTARYGFVRCRQQTFAQQAVDASKAFVKAASLLEDTSIANIAVLTIVDYAAQGTQNDHFTDQIATMVSGLPAGPVLVFYPEVASDEYARKIKASPKKSFSEDPPATSDEEDADAEGSTVGSTVQGLPIAGTGRPLKIRRTESSMWVQLTKDKEEVRRKLGRSNFEVRYPLPLAVRQGPNKQQSFVVRDAFLLMPVSSHAEGSGPQI
jgi:hypothetical protein